MHFSKTCPVLAGHHGNLPALLKTLEDKSPRGALSRRMLRYIKEDVEADLKLLWIAQYGNPGRRQEREKERKK